jgi:protein-tyrosine phosphatase
MIDIDSHIPRGLDDGPSSTEEAAGMPRVAAKAGTTDIVASPHASERFAFDCVELATGELERAAGDTPRIHYGCELGLTPEG